MEQYNINSQGTTNPAIKSLMETIGLKNIKNALCDLEHQYRIAPEHTKPGCYIFAGNPGTGKNYAAQVMAKVLVSIGILSREQVIEQNACTLLQSPSAFSQALEQSKGGILFIDEAYQFVEQWPASKDVFRQLVVAVSDPAITSTTCIILAGYPDKMKQLLEMDVSFDRHIKTILFEDFSPEEMLQILDETIKNTELNTPCPLEADEEFRQSSLRIFQLLYNRKIPNFGNARYVRYYLMECCKQLQARLERSENKEWVLRVEDISPQLQPFL